MLSPEIIALVAEFALPVQLFHMREAEGAKCSGNNIALVWRQDPASVGL